MTGGHHHRSTKLIVARSSTLYRRTDSNCRLKPYESSTLPLSYIGILIFILIFILLRVMDSNHSSPGMSPWRVDHFSNPRDIESLAAHPTILRNVFRWCNSYSLLELLNGCCIYLVDFVIPKGLEPMTYWLRVSSSTYWATEPYVVRIKRLELFPPGWKPGTLKPLTLHPQIGSPSGTRTHNVGFKDPCVTITP